MPEFLPDLPVARIIDQLSRAPGNEIKHGKFDSPDSSAALVANGFGWFLERPEVLPFFPGLGGKPPYSVELSAEVRFPWKGGRHPWLDVVVDTESLLIGIEAARYEPFRPGKAGSFPEATSRDVWGERMRRYTGVMREIDAGGLRFDSLDAVRLIKAACGLRTQAIKKARQPVLVYLYAEPAVWAGSGRAVDAARIALHRAEVARFAKLVDGDHVTFMPICWRDLLAAWGRRAALRGHVAAMAARFGALG